MNIFGTDSIIKIGSGSPTIGIVAGTHGDEFFGLEVLQELKKLDLLKGSLKLIIANPRAIKEKKRFIDADLNRIFPGNLNGNYEERRASELISILESCDYVIDLHSSSELTPSFAIITKRTKKHLEFAKSLNIRLITFMNPNMANNKSLIDHCRLGISLEMGAHNEYRIVLETLEYIYNFLEKEGMILPQERFRVLEITDFETKFENEKIEVLMKNFKSVNKGEPIARRENGEIIFASEDFIPILAGEKSYNKLISLKGKRLLEKELHVI